MANTQIYSFPGAADVDSVTVSSMVVSASESHVYLGYSLTETGGTPSGTVTFLLEDPTASSVELGVYKHVVGEPGAEHHLLRDARRLHRDRAG